MKTCRACGLVKPVSDFYLSSRGKPVAQCKGCVCARTRAYNLANLEQTRRIQREWRRRTKYGLTQEQVEELELRGVCDNCGRTADEVGTAGKSGERLHIDHDHETGEVRGILCKKCNSALGFMDDDIDRLTGLVFYLLAHQTKMTARTGA